MGWEFLEHLPAAETTVESGVCKKCGARQTMLGWEETVEEHIGHLVTIFREARRVLKPTGTLWIVIGDSYAGERLLWVPQRLAIALADDGWIARNEIIWHIPNRTPESVTNRCSRNHEHILLFAKRAGYYFDHKAIQESAKSADDPRNCKGRRTYNGKWGDGGFVSIKEKKNKRTVWSVPNQPLADIDHFASFPCALVKPMVLAGCPEGGMVLDIFGGSGTVGLVANALNRNAILIEINNQYAAIARDRIERELPKYREVIGRTNADNDGVISEAAE